MPACLPACPPCDNFCLLLLPSDSTIKKDSGTGSANTQACRMFHLSLAQKGKDDAKIHCPHAGKDGGGVCVSAKGKGYATKAIALPWFNVQSHFRLPSLTL